ncbi:signal recognition particle, SRP19 subunit [Rhizopogon vinicolor AM-OR11-026]|uniref:Signal recognition particle, SRP19 subunit n=1 Tax=Rhizopogon vinicolor AM-OR11-026 TaxID=1314800 RepID=A0A1B7N6Z3_9AGAM|nr:signal recognition particle, SRP19 subunit [Rhizopogon vinicolor AM-OR11-026]
MSHRRTAVVEEFDDDTDLPLPSRPVLDSGPRGPLLEEIGYSEGEDSESESDYVPEQGQGSQSQPPLRAPNPPGQSQGAPSNTITDITPYKKWTCVYPIYIDAKRPYGTGERRIAREKGVWWPLSKDIADATSRLGLGTLHEVQKSHPRDWENPGRVRVQWKKDGRLMNPAIKTKKQLLEMISFQIQRIKSDNIPRPPYTMTPPPISTAPSEPKLPASTKGKQPAKAKLGAGVAVQQPKHSQQRLPTPPQPPPALANRLSPYSPAVPTGMLIETVKAGMNQEPGAGPVPGLPGNMKGKRKVVRVRG